MNASLDSLLTFLVLTVCVAVLCLLANEFARAGRRERRHALGAPAWSEPRSPTKGIARGSHWRVGWLLTFGYLAGVLDPYGDRERDLEPLRGWWRAAGFIVLVACIAGFAYAMVFGDYSGLWDTRGSLP